MRVLYLSNSEQIGGGNRSLLTLCGKVRERGVNAVVTCPRPGPFVDAAREASLNCHVISYEMPGWKSPVALWRHQRAWRDLLRVVKPDVIHANGFEGARAVTLAARRAGIPLVCHIRFPQPPEFLAWVFRWLPKPDLFICNSQATRNAVGPHLERACPRSRLVVIHNAVSVERFHPRPADPEGDTRTPSVGIIANLAPVKGVNDFIQMARLLTDRGYDAQYWIIGEDIHRTGYRQELEALCAKLRLEDRVRFWGHRPDVPELVRQLDVVVVASYEEPFGLCSCEAMASQVPVVGTRAGGTMEVVADGETGLLVSPGAPQELADATARLLSDPALRREMGRAGRERVQRLFSTRKLTDDVLGQYQTLIQRKLP